MMRHRFWGAAAACGVAAAVSACASVPRLPYEGGVGVADIIRNVRCELAEAVAENSVKHPWLKGWAAGIELALDVTEAGGAGVDAEVVVPLNSITDGALGARLNRFRRAESISSISFSTTLAQVSVADCVAIPADKRHLLRGELGLKTWLARATDAIDATGISAADLGRRLCHRVRRDRLGRPRPELPPPQAQSRRRDEGRREWRRHYLGEPR